MDDVVHRLAREIAETIGVVVGEDPKVEACREKAREAGYEIKISLEAIIGFSDVVGRVGSGPVIRIDTEANQTSKAKKKKIPARKPTSHSREITANDRRFLRSLRINSDGLPGNRK